MLKSSKPFLHLAQYHNLASVAVTTLSLQRRFYPLPPPSPSRKRPTKFGKPKPHNTSPLSSGPKQKPLQKKSTTSSPTKQSVQQSNEKQTSDEDKISVFKIVKSISTDTKCMEYVNRIFAGKRRGKAHIEAVAKKLAERDFKLRDMFRSMRFVGSAKAEGSFIEPTSPKHVEVCFAGRSNVGKSSLLNSLTGAGNVAAVADKPGVTQSINFYKVSENLGFVDLPGYGFAFANEEEKEDWNELVRTYVVKRKTLKRVFVLLDAKHCMKRKDVEFLEFLNRNRVTNQIILTKSDNLYPDELAKRLYVMKHFVQKWKHTDKHVLLVSSKTKSGVLEVQQVISGIVNAMQGNKDAS